MSGHNSRAVGCDVCAVRFGTGCFAVQGHTRSARPFSIGQEAIGPRA